MSRSTSEMFLQRDVETMDDMEKKIKVKRESRKEGRWGEVR